jgi:hypothetical protein
MTIASWLCTTSAKARIAISNLHKRLPNRFLNDEWNVLVCWQDQPKRHHFYPDEYIGNSDNAEFWIRILYTTAILTDYFRFQNSGRCDYKNGKIRDVRNICSCLKWIHEFESVLETYDLMSKNSLPCSINFYLCRNAKPCSYLQTANCSTDDSIDGIYDTLKTNWNFCKSAGGIGLILRSSATRYIHGTDGQ